jgi:hypothetical protein
MDDAHQPLRQARLLERLPDPLPKQRRQAGRLENDPVARQQRHRDLVEGDRPRIVPRRDHAHDPQRLVAELGLLRQEQGLAHANGLVVEDLRARFGAPVQDVDRGDDLHRVALGDRLPLLAGQELGDLVELLDQDVSRLAQIAPPVRQRQLGPEWLHLGDVVDDRLDLRGLQRLDRAEELARGGVEGLELPHPGDSMPAPCLGSGARSLGERSPGTRAGGPANRSRSRRVVPRRTRVVAEAWTRSGCRDGAKASPARVYGQNTHAARELRDGSATWPLLSGARTPP